MYSIAGLENGIVGCRKNIAVLETAIEKERSTIAQYRIMMSQIEEAEIKKKKALDGVHLEIVRDNPN